VSNENDRRLPRILIVDDSRIVRATIIKRIRDRFDVREEMDGEAGWEALLIDPTLQLVVTDHTMPRLDGYGLIERIRASRVARIRDVPVIMISGDEDEEARQRAKDLGATDFITKGTGTAELLARLDSLVNLGRTQEALEAARADALNDLETGLLARGALLARADQILSFARRHGGHVGALIVGLDRFEEVAANVGQTTADALLKRFAEVLAGFVRKEDALGRWQRGQFAIVTAGIDGHQAGLFAERLRSAVAGVGIGIAGRTLEATVTVGVASFPADGENGEAIAAAAEARMATGMAAGGNRIENGGVVQTATGGESVDLALARIAAGRTEEVRARLPELGRRLLPLLDLLALEYGFELPMAELEGRLSAAEAEAQDGV
jgi:two-component system, cell cycle response regulator